MDANVERWFPHVTVASVVMGDGKYLMVRECNQGSSVINQPAGHVEKGETLIDAVVRETLEETGWHFEPKFISGIYQFLAGNGETYIRFSFCGELLSHQEECELDPAIEEVLWLSRQEIEANVGVLRSDAVLISITDFEKGNRLPLDSVQQLQPLQ